MTDDAGIDDLHAQIAALQEQVANLKANCSCPGGSMVQTSTEATNITRNDSRQSQSATAAPFNGTENKTFTQTAVVASQDLNCSGTIPMQCPSGFQPDVANATSRTIGATEVHVKTLDCVCHDCMCTYGGQTFVGFAAEYRACAYAKEGGQLHPVTEHKKVLDTIHADYNHFTLQRTKKILKWHMSAACLNASANGKQSSKKSSMPNWTTPPGHVDALGTFTHGGLELQGKGGSRIQELVEEEFVSAVKGMTVGVPGKLYKRCGLKDQVWSNSLQYTPQSTILVDRMCKDTRDSRHGEFTQRVYVALNGCEEWAFCANIKVTKASSKAIGQLKEIVRGWTEVTDLKTEALKLAMEARENSNDAQRSADQGGGHARRRRSGTIGCSHQGMLNGDCNGFTGHLTVDNDQSVMDDDCYAVETKRNLCLMVREQADDVFRRAIAKFRFEIGAALL